MLHPLTARHYPDVQVVCHGEIVNCQLSDTGRPEKVAATSAFTNENNTNWHKKNVPRWVVAAP